MSLLTCLTLSSSSSRCWLFWLSVSIMVFSSVHLSSSESCSDWAATLHTWNSFSRSLHTKMQLFNMNIHTFKHMHTRPVFSILKDLLWKKAHHLSLCRSLMAFWVTLRSFWRSVVSLYNIINIKKYSQGDHSALWQSPECNEHFLPFIFS